MDAFVTRPRGPNRVLLLLAFPLPLRRSHLPKSTKGPPDAQK